MNVKGTKTTRLAARALAGPLVFTDTDVWAYYQLATIPLDYRSERETERLAAGLAVGLDGLAGSEIHLLAIPCHYPVQAWANQLDSSVYRPAPGWADHLTATAAHMAGQSLQRKLVYLGVRLGARQRAAPHVSRLLRLIERAGGDDDLVVGDAEQAKWAAEADRVHRAIQGGLLAAEPVTADDTAWLIARSVRRGLAELCPSAVDKSWWGRGEIDQLVDGELAVHRQMIHQTQSDGEAWTAWLSAARLPERLAFAGGDNAWLTLHDELPFPVDLSCRWQIVPAERARSHVARRLAALRDQEQHTASSGGEVSQALDNDIDLARQLEATLTKERTPMAYGHVRWAVAAADADTVAARCDELIGTYRHHGIDVAWPPYEQLALHIESLPGDRTRVAAYKQYQDVYTLGGGLPTATGDLGDHTGPYLGVTTGRVESTVCFDPLAAPRQNREASTALVGSLGGGKTTAMCLLLHQMVLRGTSAMVIEPKGDTVGLATMLGIGDSRVIDLGSGEPGLLDPFALADDTDEAARMAADVLEMMLPSGTGYPEHTAIMSACHAEARRTQRPCLNGVIDRLERDTHEVAQGLALNLRAIADLPTARVCFSAADGGHLDPQDQLTIIHAGSLDLPEPGTPHDQMRWSERLSVAVMWLVADTARRLCRRRDRNVPKAIALDEAWMLTNTDAGRKLVPELARLGRTFNTALLLASQNARDLLDERVRNCIGSVFAFRSADQSEVEAVEALLGVASDSGVAADLPTLGSGECIARDLAGRVGRMQIDLAYDPRLVTALNTTPEPHRADHDDQPEATHETQLPPPSTTPHAEHGNGHPSPSTAPLADAHTEEVNHASPGPADRRPAAGVAERLRRRRGR